MDNGKDDFYAEDQETHATVLDKLLAWEKKLYDEVKVPFLCLCPFSLKAMRSSHEHCDDYVSIGR